MDSFKSCWSNNNNNNNNNEVQDPYFQFPHDQYFSGDIGVHSNINLEEGFILDVTPLMDCYPAISTSTHELPLYSAVESFDFQDHDFLYGKGNSGSNNNGVVMSDELVDQMLGDIGDHQPKPLLLCNDETRNYNNNVIKEERVIINNNKDVNKNNKRCRLISSSEDNVNNNSNNSTINGGVSKTLSREILSQYYYMPITKAAKELNVGLTLLKKRCRELGISRWPHRKLMSLQTLIKNVQEFGNGDENEGEDLKIKNVIKLLEREKNRVEEIPDVQLNNTTKRLRQACFKANYKKRKLQAMTDSESALMTNNIIPRDGEDDDQELKSLLTDDSFSSGNLLDF